MAGLSLEGRARIVDWENGHRKRSTWGAEAGSKMFDRLPTTYKLDARVLRAVRAFLQARSYDLNHQHDRCNIKHIPEKAVADLKFEVFSSWRSSSDDGKQLFRTSQTRRPNTKDASWARVSISAS